MKVLFKARGGNFVLSCAVASLLMMPTANAVRADAAGADDHLTIVLDEARLIKMPDRVATVIVGNPLIADVTIQPGGLMVLTGKGYGRTNLMALDRSGNKLLEKDLLVRGPVETVTVYRGIQRETYSCAPKCEPRNVIGDAPLFFNTSLNQIVTRNNQAGAIK